MVSKGLISFIAIVCIAVITAMVIYAYQARKVSDKILEEFKAIDNNLQQSTERIDSLNTIYFDSLRKADK